MRGQENFEQQPNSPLDSGPDRLPNGAGVLLAVTTGTLCWVGLFALFL